MILLPLDLRISLGRVTVCGGHLSFSNSAVFTQNSSIRLISEYMQKPTVLDTHY